MGQSRSQRLVQQTERLEIKSGRHQGRSRPPREQGLPFVLSVKLDQHRFQNSAVTVLSARRGP